MRVQTDELADGVYLLRGASHNSVAVEFKDYPVVMIAALYSAMTIMLISLVIDVAYAAVDPRILHRPEDLPRQPWFGEYFRHLAIVRPF